jgi:hypothetical protein
VALLEFEEEENKAKQASKPQNQSRSKQPMNDEWSDLDRFVGGFEVETLSTSKN